MIDWGLSDDDLGALVRGVGRDAGDANDRQEAMARALWSLLVEPDDRAAGTLVGAVGAVEAARLMLESPVARVIAHATGGELDGRAAARAIARWMPRRRHGDLVRSLESAARCGARLLVPGDEHWPESLADLGERAPLALWVRGDASLLVEPSVAIVGARAASGYGEHVAMELAAGAVQRGVVVVSGGAYGIDGMAHRAALASGGGTIAVLAGGVDRFYPAGHEALLTRIAQQGAVVAETPCGAAPTRWRFLRRNRIIAALGGATVVVEAGRRSGSLSTAGAALEIGRPVGAVPGPVTSATSAGCHALLRKGPVTCVTTPGEVIELLPSWRFGAGSIVDSETPSDPANSEVVDSTPDPDGLIVRVVDALRPRRAQTVDELARAVGEAPARIRGVLGALALDERATQHDDGWTRRDARRERPESRAREGNNVVQ